MRPVGNETAKHKFQLDTATNRYPRIHYSAALNISIVGSI